MLDVRSYSNPRSRTLSLEITALVSMSLVSVISNSAVIGWNSAITRPFASRESVIVFSAVLSLWTSARPASTSTSAPMRFLAYVAPIDVFVMRSASSRVHSALPDLFRPPFNVRSPSRISPIGSAALSSATFTSLSIPTPAPLS